MILCVNICMMESIKCPEDMQAIIDNGVPLAVAALLYLSVRVLANRVQATVRN